jgi:hypothetical protein
LPIKAVTDALALGYEFAKVENGGQLVRPQGVSKRVRLLDFRHEFKGA